MLAWLHIPVFKLQACLVEGSDRIISLAQPHVSPTVRGKAGTPVEFGAKTRLATAAPGGITKIEMYCNGYTVLADVKTKTFKRFLEKAMEYDYWEGIVSGKLHHIQGHQLILTHAGLHCRERKTGG